MTGVVYGAARLGVLVPSGNSVAETELRAMLPDSVTMLTTRLALRGSSEAELLAMLTDLDRAATLLGHAEPDAIAFHCTAVSTYAPHLAGEIRVLQLLLSHVGGILDHLERTAILIENRVV